MLTDAQIRQFHAFGYLLLPRWFTTEQAAMMKQEADDIMIEARGGNPLDGKALMQVHPFFELRPFLSKLLDDDRVYGLGEDLVGPGFALDGTEGNYYVGDTPWHGAQGQYMHLREIKIVFYLDRLTKDSGALRVIPGTHIPTEPDHLAELRPRNDDPDFRPFGLHPHDVPAVALETEPGDVVIFTEDTLHGAFGGHAMRRHMAVSFFRLPKTQVQHAFLREQYESARWSFHPTQSCLNSDSPRVRRLVEPLVQLGHEALQV